MSKKDFKMFVRSNPYLINYINDGTMTWQKFYEMYDIYGENNSVWDNYRKTNSNTEKKNNTVGDTSIKEIFNMIKKVDLDQVKKGAEGLQKAISLIQGLNKPSEVYQARPLYEHLDD